MFDGEKSASLKVEISTEQLVLTIIELYPLLLMPVFWALLVSGCSKILTTKARDMSELLFFGFIGSIGAYLNAVSEGKILENVLPSTVVVLTALFQLLIIARPEKFRPLIPASLYLAASGTALCYMVGSSYIASFLT